MTTEFIPRTLVIRSGSLTRQEFRSLASSVFKKRLEFEEKRTGYSSSEPNKVRIHSTQEDTGNVRVEVIVNLNRPGYVPVFNTIGWIYSAFKDFYSLSDEELQVSAEAVLGNKNVRLVRDLIEYVDLMGHWTDVEGFENFDVSFPRLFIRGENNGESVVLSYPV